MRNRFRKLLSCGCLTGLFLAQVGGCTVDPDILLRAGLSFASDLTIFLLDNLVASL